MEHSLGLLRAAIPCSIEIVADLAQTAHVRGNRGQLHQIIVNLLSNAAQAIGDRPGKIYLSIRIVRKGDENRPEAFLGIKVTDTGMRHERRG